MGEFITFFKESLVHHNNYIAKNSALIKRKIREEIYIINCKRIVAIAPFNLLYFIIVFLQLLNKQTNNELFSIMFLFTILLLLHTFIFSGIIIWVIFVKEKSKTIITYEYQFIFLSYWALWIIGMSIFSYIQIQYMHSGTCFIILCVIANIIPLYSIKEFFFHAIIMFASYGTLRLNFPMLDYAYIAIILLGFVAQRLEINLWISNEYIYECIY
jgi:hypothetical protein